jgi:thiaminase
MLTESVLSEVRARLEEIEREPFLAALAENRLSDEALGRWVREDTHFLRALRRMIARLVTDAPTEQAVDVMTGAYPALQAELDRFAAEAERLGEDLASEPAPVTRRFNALLLEAAAAGFAEGIGTYWAVELAYLEAWSAVRRRIGLREPYAGWIENWTSDGFRAFVAALGALVDAHGDSSAMRRRTLEVLELERELWRFCHDGVDRD